MTFSIQHDVLRLQVPVREGGRGGGREGGREGREGGEGEREGREGGRGGVRTVIHVIPSLCINLQWSTQSQPLYGQDTHATIPLSLTHRAIGTQ